VSRKARARGASRKLDAYLAFAIFAAVGVATWTVDQLLRLTLLWLVLLGSTLIYAAAQRLQFSYNYSDLARGAVSGSLISLPVLLAARSLLLGTSQRLFPAESTLTLLWAVVLFMPAAEAVYFRGFLQREKGLWAAVLLYAGAGVVYFLPVTWDQHLPVLAALCVGMGLLGFIYSYVRAMHGLVSSLVCQSVVDAMLFVVPCLAQRLWSS
jgi:hypothetical protein